MSHHDAKLGLFAEHVLGNDSFDSIYEELVELRELGISAQEVLSLLQELRLSCPNTPTEDRILDTMDYVTGYCRSEDVIWPRDP